GSIIGPVPLALHGAIENSGPLSLGGLPMTMAPVVPVIVPPMGLVQGAWQGNTVAPILGHGLLKGLQGDMGFHFQGRLPLFEIDRDMLYPLHLGKGLFHVGSAAVTAHPMYLISMFHDFLNY